MTKTLLISAGLAAVSTTIMVLALSTPAAQAGMISALRHCANDSKGKTIHCCETQMENASLLLKQSLAGKSCQAIVSCSLLAGDGKRCKIRVIYTPPSILYSEHGGNAPEVHVPERKTSPNGKPGTVN